MGIVFSLTLKERKQIKYCIDNMLSQKQISIKLGRASSCINKEIGRNGGRDEYNPQIAHEKSLERRLARIEKLRNNNPWHKLKKQEIEIRVSNLEMQIEIIIEQIKELLNDRIN